VRFPTPVALLVSALLFAIVSPLTTVALAAEPERGLKVQPKSDSVSDYSDIRRLALVLGNSNYRHGELRNAGNDARDMSKALKRLGFTVVEGYDLDKKAANRKIREFGNKLGPNKVGLFYYAGHGAQYHGIDYLIPLSADIETQDEIDDEAINAGTILDKMEAARNGFNIMILDACRDNPFPRSFSRSAGSSGWSGSLADDAPRGSLVAYATGRGQKASDGTGRNGLYTKHLLEAIESRQLELNDVFKQVRRRVLEESGDLQMPWERSSLTGDFYFNRRNTGSSGFAVLPPELAQPESTNPAPTPKYGGLPLPEMIPIPAAQFFMGRSDGNLDERPRHSVELTAFHIGRYEVTFEQYDAFVQDTGRAAPSDMRWGRGKRPVVNVSWEDATAYAAWLSEETGVNYRLPTEAEWEYVAQNLAGDHFSFGNDLAVLCKFGNGADSDTDFTWRNRYCNDPFAKMTAPVGEFSANRFGVYDMHGNVWEWVADCWTPDYSQRGGEDCRYRVMRGGAWDSRPESMRSANRSKNAPTRTNHNFGFRVVME
jgi:formylglycine-generating enzyme required for sulfatase activity